MQRINGLIAAAYPALDKNGSLNLNAIQPYAELLSKNMVDGVFLNGSTGDFGSLSISERKQIVDEWSQCKPSGFKLMVHVGDAAVNNSIELAKHAAAANVDAISTLANYYYPPRNIHDLVLTCQKIAESSQQTPFYYYHIPQMTNCNFDMVEFLNLAGDAIPNFRGLKYSQEDMMQFKYCLNFEDGKYDVLFGSDQTLVCALALGAKGAVGSTYNHLAPLYHKIIDLFHQGKIETAYDLQYQSMQFVKTLAAYGFHAASKTTLEMLGLDLGPVRLPQRNLLPNELTSLKKKLTESNILEWANPL
jgi:N-acetylneuraminate lyase